ncbi:MAG: hypothetical protein OZ921_01670 [Sorangiineae bacterium]|nr:hypothetical protein [Polyangiaceae bacterium]MEB2321191.1 hypothetical protein [Sorangiineae bacterium]
MEPPISIALRETLDSVVSPTVRDAMLVQALRDASIDEIPSDPRAFRDFSDGPLRQVLERGLGAALADAVLDEIARLTDALGRADPGPKRRSSVSSQLRAVRTSPCSSRPPQRRPSPRPATLRAMEQAMMTPPPWSGPITKPPAEPLGAGSASGETRIGRIRADASTPVVPVSVSSWPASSAPAELPRVLVLSRDADTVQRLSAWLEPQAVAVPVGGLRRLLDELDGVGRERVAILFDCRSPPIRATALAALADELPAAAQVVLWGASGDLTRALLAISPKTIDWVNCRGDARAKDVAERCSLLVS